MIPDHARGLVASALAENRYVRDLRAISRQVAKGTARAIAKHLVPATGRLVPDPGAAPDFRQDALGRISAHGATFDTLAAGVAAHVDTEVGHAFDRMATAVDRKNLVGVKSLVAPHASTLARRRVAVRRDAVTIDPRVLPLVAAFRKKNIELMRKAGSDYLEKVRGVLEDPENDGLRVEELAKRFTVLAEAMEERGDVFASRAELIARDQTLKLNAQLTEARVTAAGVTSYVWSTSLDERVRPMHRALGGQTFEYGSPPVTNEDGDTNNPGEDFQCRCVGLPVTPDFDDM